MRGVFGDGERSFYKNFETMHSRKEAELTGKKDRITLIMSRWTEHIFQVRVAAGGGVLGYNLVG